MENCKGCNYDIRGCGCLNYNLPTHILDKCPCRICLVKMICELGCKEFITFYRVESKKHYSGKASRGKLNGKL